MNAKDFMIGNWVQNVITGKPAKVFEIREKYLVLDDLEFIWAEDIRSIPLTNWILEANGFKKVPFDGSDFWCHWELKVETKEKESFIRAYETPLNGLLVIINKPNACEPIFRNQLEFVHEFQNSLRLCHFEMEINLGL